MTFQKIKRSIIGAVYPRDACCSICGDDINETDFAVCSRCEALLPHCGTVRNDIDGLSFLLSAFEYKSPISETIHRYKYKNQRYLAGFFASYMAKLIPDETYCLVGVPLHNERKKQRGFCQTDELCIELSLLTSIEFQHTILRRIRNTPSQTKLSGKERELNLKDAFSAEEAARGKKILLIDDVATSGSTLRESARALYEAGAAEVAGLVIATTKSASQ